MKLPFVGKPYRVYAKPSSPPSASDERMAQTDLIFDLGLHKGFDSCFYLAKGFRVIGLEAVPDLCSSAQTKLGKYGRKFLAVNKALAERPGEKVTFYTVPGKDDWGSLVKNAAEKGLYPSIAIEVSTTSIHELFDTYGVPYYVKCDLEGADVIFRNQLLTDDRRPVFVSLEANGPDDIDILMQCGYEVGQIVNQWMHPFTKAPNPSREGTYVEAKFNGETSGLFGRDLPHEKWRPLREIREMFVDWKSLKQRDDALTPGWVDFHVCRRSALE